jgi:hypothetical protein
LAVGSSPFAGDAFQQDGGGLVLGVLRDELAGRGRRQDGGPETFTAPFRSGHGRFELVKDRKLPLHSADDAVLL